MVIIRPTSTCLIRLNHVHVSRFHLTQHHSFFESRNLFTFKSCLHQCSVQFLSWVKFHHLSVLYLFIFLCLEWYTLCYLLDILKCLWNEKLRYWKIGEFERPLKGKKNGVFLFVISHLVPEIFKIFVLCKLGTDDVIRCDNMKVKTQNRE